MPLRPLTRLRKLCLALPGACEVEAWSAPTFRAPKKLFAMYAKPESHTGNGRPAVWIKAAPENQRLMVAAAPTKFFVPAYVGPSGWIGVWLDGTPNWKEIAELLEDGYRMVATKKLVLQLEQERS